MSSSAVIPASVDVDEVLTCTPVQLGFKSPLIALGHLFALQEARATVYNELER
jgi:hypothetical protein